jgi:uncharacterized alpha-E superfamily protein
MSRYIERAEDTAELYIGGVIFSVVAALAGAVMAVGFVAIEGVHLLRHK